MTPLSHGSRRLFFLAVVAIFFTTTAGVLLHTFGYRFSTERGIFIYTGSITLEVNPADGLALSIDGIPVSEKRRGSLNNSLHISGLPPGEHFLEVKADGFQPWTKKVVVESGRSTEFWNIQLARLTPDWQTFRTTENAVSLAPGPQSGLFALVKRSGEEYSVDIFDVEQEKSEQVFSILDAIQPTPSVPLLWSPDGEYLLVPTGEDGVRYYLVSVRTRESRPLNNLVPGASLSHFRFDPNLANLLFFQSGQSLYRVDITTPASPPEVLSETVAAYDLSGRFLYFIESQGGIVYRSALERNAWNPTQVTLEALPTSISQNTSALAYQIFAYDAERFAILEKTVGRLLVYSTGLSEPLREIAASGVRGAQFSDDGKKLLFFTDNEISVYFVEDWKVQPTRAADTQSQIARFSQTLGHVEWAKEYEHVLFTLGNDVKVIELDSRDHRNILDLAHLSVLPLQILSQFGDNRLYFVGPAEAGAPPVVRALTFPEPTGFFGF